MQKYLITFLLFFSILYSSAQNNTLKGVIILQSSGKKPLSEVAISSFGGNKAYSNSSGQFEIIYPNKKAGDRVSLFFEKDGYEVVNDKEMEDVIIRNDPDDIVKVIMCNVGERNKLAMSYYNIILENAQRKIDAQLQSLNKKVEKLTSNDQEKQVLYNQINALIQEKEQWALKAEKLAKKLADFNTDNLSEFRKEALDLLVKGQIEEALKILSDETLDQFTQNAKTKVAEADSLMKIAIDNYLLKAQLCRADFRLKEAEKNYSKALEISDYSYSVMDEAILFYLESSPEKALSIIQTALKKYDDNEKVTAVLNYLLAISYINNRTNISYAEQILQKAKNYFLPLAIDYPKHYGKHLAHCYLYLSKIARTRKDDNLAIEYLDKALIHAHHHQVSLQIYTELVFFHLTKGDYQKSKDQLNELRELIDIWYKDTHKSKSYLEDLVCFLTKMIDTIVNKGNEAEAIDCNQESDAFRVRQLQTTVIETVALVNIKDYGKAVELYISCIDQVEKLKGISDHQKNYYKVFSYRQIPMLFKWLDQHEQAISYAKKSVKFCDTLVTRVSDKYLPDLAYAHYTLGDIYWEKKDSLNAIIHYREAIDILEPLKGNKKYSQTDIFLDLAKYYASVAWLYYYGRFKNGGTEGLPYNLKSIEYLTLLYDSNETPYFRKKLVDAHQLSARIYFQKLEQFDQALTSYQTVLGYLREISDTNEKDHSYDRDLLECFKYIAKSCLKTGDHERAINYAKLGLIKAQELDRTYDQTQMHRVLAKSYLPIEEDSSVYFFQQFLLTGESSIKKSTGSCIDFTREIEEDIQYLRNSKPTYFSKKLLGALLNSRVNILITADFSVSTVLTNTLKLDRTLFSLEGIDQVIESRPEYMDVKIWYLSQIISQIKEDKDKITPTKEALSFIENRIERFGDAEIYASSLSRSYGNLSYDLIMSEQFEEARQAAKKGIKYGPENLWIYTNLALSHLGTNNWDEAKKIYDKLKDQSYKEGLMYREVFLEDLETLKRKQVSCVLCERATNYLKKDEK